MLEPCPNFDGMPASESGSRKVHEQEGNRMLGSKKVEHKQTLDSRQFVTVMRDWLNAIERQQDFSLPVAGNPCVVPASAMENGHFRVEYEIDKGEHEFELTLKWR
jgi:hypothetical protein